MDWTTLFQTVLPYLPARYAGDLVSILTFLIAAAALALRFWKPPTAGNKLALLYKAVASPGSIQGLEHQRLSARRQGPDDPGRCQPRG